MSNKKTLLNEGTIRRFMTLANMDNLAESYLDRHDIEEGKHDEDEEEVEEGMRPAKDDDEKELDEIRLGEEEEEIEMGAEEPAAEPELEMPAPEEAPAEEGGADEAMVKKLVDAIAGAIEGATGVEVAVEGGDEEPEMDMGEPEEGGEELEMGAEEEGGEEPPMGDLEEDENFDAYIAEVTRRVAKRIIKKKISK
jgi:hypothetical protein